MASSVVRCLSSTKSWLSACRPSLRCLLTREKNYEATKKASNMAMSVSRFINIHKLRCHMIPNYCYYTILVFVMVLKVLVNNREITLCIPKLR